jgi:tetratricopeptide (TPR) repeat protein
LVGCFACCLKYCREEAAMILTGRGHLIPRVVRIGAAVVVSLIMFGSSCTPADRAVDCFRRGLNFHQQGRWDLAIEEHTEAIALDPQCKEAYNNRGWACIGKGDLDKAIADYDQAIALDPQCAEAYFNRGRAHAQLGLVTWALADLSKAIEIAGDAQAYYFRGFVYAEIGEQQEAISDLERALELSLDPTFEQEAETLLEELTQQ